MDESKDSSRQSTLSGSTEPVSLTRSALREAIKFSPLNCIPPATQAKDLKTAGAADNGSGLEKKRASVVAQVHFLPTPVPDIVASHINYPGWKLAKSISPTSWRKLRRQEQLARTMIEMILTQQRLKLASLQTQVLQQQVMILAAELQIIESRQAMIDVEAGLHLKSAIASLSRRVQQTSEYVLKTLKIPTTTEGQLLQLRVPQISALVGAPFFQVKSVTHRTPRPPLTAFNLCCEALALHLNIHCIYSEFCPVHTAPLRSAPCRDHRDVLENVYR